MTGRGFTLVDLLVSLALVAVVMAVSLTLLHAGTRAYLFGARRVEVQQSARPDIERLMRVVRNGSFVTEADLHRVTIISGDGMVTAYANEDAMLVYHGAHGETQDILYANPSRIRGVTITLGPYQSTATLRAPGGAPTDHTPICATGPYVPGGWNVFCR
jgi:type II secretory pathway pseudopilin PulG